MKLKCNNCKHGPCETKSRIVLLFTEFSKDLCPFWSTVAKWELEPEISPNPWKAPAAMIFQNAIQIMKPGDSFKTGREILTMIEHDGTHVFRSDLHAGLVFVEPDLLKTKGQIIPAKPKVLSEDEAFEMYRY